jgi:hypothetical protein
LAFLEAQGFWFGIPSFEGWILLDFLGFSRQNLDFSMSYARFLRKNFSRGIPDVVRRRDEELAVEAVREAQDCSWRELTLVSDFLQ